MHRHLVPNKTTTYVRQLTLLVVFLTSFLFIGNMIVTTHIHAQEIGNPEEVAPVSIIETVSSTPSTERIPENIQEYAPGALDVRTQERILNLSENIRMRIRAVTDRMEGISIRLESRMNKLEKEGLDTTRGRSLIAQAYELQNETRAHLTKLDALPTLISSDTPRASFATIRGEFESAHDTLARTRTLLFETVRELRALVTGSSSVVPLPTEVSNAPEN